MQPKLNLYASATWALGAKVALLALLTGCGGGEGPTTLERRADAPADAAAATATAAAAATATTTSSRASPALAGRAHAMIGPGLRGRQGPVEVWVTLAEASLAQTQVALRTEASGASLASGASEASESKGRHWKHGDADLSVRLKAHKQALHAAQDRASAALAALGAVELARVSVAHNAIAVRVDAARLDDIAALPGVRAVRPVRDYQLNGGEAAPHPGPGIAPWHAGRHAGAGVRVAVLDSGIDYTHRNLGGAGTPGAFAAAYGSGPADVRNTTRDGLFPTTKVVDGRDFVGEAWPFCPGFDDCRVQDPDPIDFRGHGTHVADIIAGVDPARGVAPGAELIAVKVCSSMNGTCRGVQILQGVDFALDPNGDGDLSDAADVINLSFSEVWGQTEDVLSFALDNAVQLGVVVVAAAGDQANRPYIVGAPSIAPGVISVAQTHAPGALSMPLRITSPPAIAGLLRNAFGVAWAPLGAGFGGEVAAVGGGCPGYPEFGIDPEPYLVSPSGKVALIDAYAFDCGVSEAVHRAAQSGAIAVLVGTAVDGEPLTWSQFFGPVPFSAVPTLMLTRADAERIKANLPVLVSLAPVPGVSLESGVVATSSRGPASDSTIKPELAAPGAWLSAVAGSGDAVAVFGGTSGAAAMVSGAAAVLRGAYPERTPLQIKAMLMNSAHTAVFEDPAGQPGVLAPITRVGAGELRLERALALRGVAYDKSARSAALSFGFAEVERGALLTRELRIDNFSRHARTYTLNAVYRYGDDEASGATSIDMPRTVTVPGRGSASVEVKLRVDGSRLPDWGLNGGSLGGRGDLLAGNEVDGFITLVSGSEVLSVPFQALLRKSASLAVSGGVNVPVGKDFKLKNNGIHAGAYEVFALTGTSARVGQALQAGRGDGFATIDLRAVGVRTVEPGLLQFAVSRWDRRAHTVWPATISIDIDTDNDGVADHFVGNSAPGVVRGESGQTRVGVFSTVTFTFETPFFLDADLQSASSIFTVKMADLGLAAGRPFSFSVYACDYYFGGDCGDAIERMTYTPGSPRYGVEGGLAGGPLGPREQVRLKVVAVAGGAAASPSQTGFLLLYRRNKDNEIDIVTVKP